jgi:hypothetical protein
MSAPACRRPLQLAHTAPPRAWGTPAGWAGRIRAVRSTPTCVGRTRRDPLRNVAAAKHPQVRGEHSRTAARTRLPPEAPPRAWAAPARSGRRTSASRSTPTCVGARYAPTPALVGTRSTPTCVGSTRFAGWCPSRSTKHPHVRAEHGWQFAIVTPHSEAPPRAWGARLLPRRCLASLRSTPTCVGAQQRGAPARLGVRSTPTCVGSTLPDLEVYPLRLAFGFTFLAPTATQR